MIAAGGTAGHVRPALAVGEALRARGVTVTFAGSPDRVESRLVPEAGFELDTFAITGFPRRPRLGLVRALVAGRAGAVRLPARSSRRRRPDVVLGGGGYVAGPMVLAARLRGIPAALTEADAHLGLANRLAAPFAHEASSSRTTIAGAGRAARYRGRRPARSRAPTSAPSRAEARRAVRARLPTARSWPSSARSPGRTSLNEMAVDAWGDAGPAVLHVSGERDYDGARGRACTAPTTC